MSPRLVGGGGSTDRVDGAEGQKQLANARLHMRKGMGRMISENAGCDPRHDDARVESSQTRWI